MQSGDLLILNAQVVSSVLKEKEKELIDITCRAYVAHANGESSLPRSTFLRFPKADKNRIIALPAYLGDEWNVAGLKWVASFPGNLEVGLERASALVILNSTLTGRPEAILEGSMISAKRTAASAALAADWLHKGGHTPTVGMIGCGLINFEIARFLRAIWPDLARINVYDLDRYRANQFKERCQNTFDGMQVEVSSRVEDVFRSSALLSFATTASKPHIFDITACSPGSTILHISLRDLSPEVILSCDNVVDDIDHVCREQTSIHLAEQQAGNRDFIRCTLADIVLGRAPARKDSSSITVFSPFGLGILDLAVSQYVRDISQREGNAAVVPSFLPGSPASTSPQSG